MRVRLTFFSWLDGGSRFPGGRPQRSSALVLPSRLIRGPCSQHAVSLMTLTLIRILLPILYSLEVRTLSTAHAEGEMGHFYFERDIEATVLCWEATPVAHSRTKVTVARCSVMAARVMRSGWLLPMLIKYHRFNILWG